MGNKPRKTISCLSFLFCLQWVICTRANDTLYWRYAKDLEKNWKSNLSTSFSYLQSHVEYAFQYWTPTLNDKVFPTLQVPYNYLSYNHSEQIRKVTAPLGEAFKPIITQQDLKKFEDYASQRVPTWVKVRVSQIYQWLIDYVKKHDLKDVQLSDKARAAYAFLKAEMNPSQDQQLVARVERLFYQIMPYMKDQGLRDCQRIHVLSAEHPNSMQDGCNVYITEGLKVMTDEEIMAILAHELSHEDQGHNVRTYALLLRQMVDHHVYLLKDNLVWAFTGHAGKILLETAEIGHSARILDVNDTTAATLEFEADTGAVDILCRARVPIRHLKSLFVKLYAIYGYSDDEVVKGLNKNYPTLNQRLRNIEAQEKLCPNPVVL